MKACIEHDDVIVTLGDRKCKNKRNERRSNRRQMLSNFAFARKQIGKWIGGWEFCAANINAFLSLLLTSCLGDFKEKRKWLFDSKFLFSLKWINWILLLQF